MKKLSKKTRIWIFWGMELISFVAAVVFASIGAYDKATFNLVFAVYMDLTVTRIKHEEQ